MPPKTSTSLYTLLFAFLAALFFVGCKTPKDIVYFQNMARDTALSNTVTPSFDLKIRPDDLLYIGVTSADPTQSILFNAPQMAVIGASGGTTGGTTSGYLVDKAGRIQVYKLGDVAVAGLTRDALKERLQKDLAPYLKDPVVTVRFLNHRVTVLGEVGKPQVLPLNAEQLTVLEALGQSGDLTPFGRRDNILVIRQTDKGKEFKRISLLDNSVFTSPYFFLQNEDVVYVEPDLKRKSNQKAQTISYIISGASVLILILDRVFK